MTTIYTTHPRYTEHNMQGHPEHAGRIESVWQVMEQAQLTEKLHVVTPEPVTDEQILAVHTPHLLDVLKRATSQRKLTLIDADTYALPSSLEVAKLSAGAVVTAIDAVLAGEAKNGIAACRPPGHHATDNRSMGFCLLNNIAIGARYAQQTHNINKVLIMDFDVHHGNGTQDIFYEDNSVFFISSHQYPFYPGTGSLQETGRNQGKGYTLNIPLRAGYGDAGFLRFFREIIWKATRKFQPELILVSAGFDAHWKDPLAMMRLSLAGYTQITRELIKMADELCDGKIVFVMEGGYDLTAIGHGMRNIAHALLGEDEISDPYGKAPGSEPDISSLIQQVQQIHHL